MSTIGTETEAEESYLHLCNVVSNSESLQKLHYGTTIQELNKINSDDKKEIPVSYSPFVMDLSPTSYYYTWEQICCGDVKESKNRNQDFDIVYNINNNSHAITGFTISNILPKVVAEPGYKVRWCNNVASHIVQFGKFSHNNIILYEFDELTSDINIAFPRMTENIESINRDIGNIPQLQTFSSVLPQYNTVFNPSFPFCSPDPADMFPLYMCGSADRILISLTLRKLCSSLLIIAKVNDDDDELEIIVPNPNVKYFTLIQNGETVENFSYPTCVAHYVYLTQDECNSNWCMTESNNSRERDNVSFFVTASYPFKSLNPSNNKINEIKIETKDYCNTIFWVAENIKNKKLHIYSNYTQNPSTLCDLSISPIVTTTINNGAVTILKNAPTILTTRILQRFNSRISSKIPGIHIKSFGIRSSDGTIKPGLQFKNGLISCEVKDNCPEILNNESYDDNESLYDIEARLFCRVEYTFSRFCKSETERKTITSLIEKVRIQ